MRAVGRQSAGLKARPRGNQPRFHVFLMLSGAALPCPGPMEPRPGPTAAQGAVASDCWPV